MIAPSRTPGPLNWRRRKQPSGTAPPRHGPADAAADASGRPARMSGRETGHPAATISPRARTVRMAAAVAAGLKRAPWAPAYVRPIGEAEEDLTARND
ncbi:hypothetical protein MTO96_013118 [Rhipicephalus appendiculatus]